MLAVRSGEGSERAEAQRVRVGGRGVNSESVGVVVNDRLANLGECLADDSVGTGTGGGDSRVWCGNSRPLRGSQGSEERDWRLESRLRLLAGAGLLSQALDHRCYTNDAGGTLQPIYRMYTAQPRRIYVLLSPLALCFHGWP
jgi:hypothetical protein